MRSKPKIHYRMYWKFNPDSTMSACGKYLPDNLTNIMDEVTCGGCRRSLHYRHHDLERQQPS